jgi:hypothetical protein
MFRKFFSAISGIGSDQRLSHPAEDRHPMSSPVARLFLKASFTLAATFIFFSVLGAGSLQAAQDERKALTDRAKALWEARVKGDWGTVFEYLAETEKKTGTKEEYIAFSKEKGPFRYLSYKLEDVDVEGSVGWVKTAYELEPTRFPGLPPNKVNTWQVWEKRDGQWFPIPNERQLEVPKLPPRLRPLKDENAVMARANEFWQAREKDDYKAVYQYLPPAFREKVPAEEFLGKKALNSYVGHSVHWAEVSGDRAKVRVTVDYRPNDPNMTKMDPLQETTMQEWVKVNNQWYLDVREPQE